MVDPHIDEATVVDQVIDAIRDGFPIRKREVIIDIDGRFLPFGLPFPPVVLELANQLFLLAIDGNDWLPFGCISFPGAIDVLKLGVPVGMRRPSILFLLALSENPIAFNILRMAVSPIVCPWLREGLPQLAYRLARPSDQALRISLRLQHLFQIGL